MKELNVKNMLADLNYTVNGTYVHEFLYKLCPPQDKMRVLEPGCGSAKLSMGYALNGCYAEAFDIDQSVVNYARGLRNVLECMCVKWYGPLINCYDIFEDMQTYPDSYFDLVLNEGVPQHWPEDDKRQYIISQMARVSKNIVVVIGNNGHNPHEQEVDRSFQFKYEGMPPIRRCFTVEELSDKLMAAGLTHVHIVPLPVDVPLGQATLIAGYGIKNGEEKRKEKDK